MSESPMEHLKQQLIDNKMVAEDGFIGCTADEIERIRIGQKLKRLPSDFADYLQVMGKAGLRDVKDENLLPPHDDFPTLKDKMIAAVGQSATLHPEALVFDVDKTMWFYYVALDDDAQQGVWYYDAQYNETERIHSYIEDYFVSTFEAYKKRYFSD